MKTFGKVLLLILGIVLALVGVVGALAGDLGLGGGILAVGVLFIFLGKPKKADPSVRLGPPTPEGARPPEPVPVPVSDPEEEPAPMPVRAVDPAPQQPQVIYVQQVPVQPAEPEHKPDAWMDSLLDTEARRRKERIKENRRNGIACCPKCGSTSLSVNKKGYSFVKGVLIGPIGGTMGMNKLRITCLNCGNVFKPGQK